MAEYGAQRYDFRSIALVQNELAARLAQHVRPVPTAPNQGGVAVPSFSLGGNSPFSVNGKHFTFDSNLDATRDQVN